MDRFILDDIPIELEEKGVAVLLRIKPGSGSEGELSKILHEARLAARPKAAFVVAEAHPAGGDTVEIGGVTFTSRILCANLGKAGVVFPYAATCGSELEEWSRTMHGTLRSFWADTIMLLALGSAVSFLERHMKEKLGEGIPLSSMNPGSLEDWPLDEQAPLISVLGDCASAIGVSLLDRMVLCPLKSVSGIHFVSKDGFVNCSMCPRQVCPSRRAAYDPSLYQRMSGPRP